MTDSFFWDYWYRNTDNIQTSQNDRKILYENKLLGSPRLRQVRVRPNSCTVYDDFRRTFSTCYAPYSREAEDTEPFGPAIGTAWNYKSEEELGGRSFWGQIASYSGGGYYQDLPMRKKQEMNFTIAVLKDNLWIRRGTRVVFLDFTTYNANVNLFCIVKLVMELPPTGGALTSWKFTTVKLLRYITAFDYFVLGCELAVIAFIIYYILEEIREMYYFKLMYLSKKWNLFDLLIILLTTICIGISIYRTKVVNEKIDRLLERTEEYPNFETLAYWEIQYNNMMAVVVFFVWIKLFKYIKFNKTMNQLSMTLSKCSKDVLGFSLMFFIVFLGYAQLGYLIFGNEVEAFSTVVAASFTMLRIILGDFDYNTIEKVDRVAAPIFFLSYIFFVIFVLVNVFLAIISDTYSEVKAETQSTDLYDMGKFLCNGFHNICVKMKICKKKKKDEVPQDEVPQDDKLTGRKLREMLTGFNFTDSEVDIFLASYNIENDETEITPDDAIKILADMENETPDDIFPHAGSSAEFVPLADFNALQKRVEVVEVSVRALLPRVLKVVGDVEWLLQERMID